MKRYIHSSTNSFKKIDGYHFSNILVDALKQLLPKNCYPKNATNAYGHEIEIENVPSRKRIYDATVKALESLGYDIYNIRGQDDEGYELAAVKGDAFAKLLIDVGDYFNNGVICYIDIKCDNGNVILEDWYDG